MQIFISWSKEPSRSVAQALRDWLPDVIQPLKPWMSSTDVGAGTRWSSEVATALATTKVGILCVTPDNQREPWLLFEAGALAKTLNDTFVSPYLIQMATSDLVPGPLTQFQSKLANRDGTFELLSTINAALGSEALPPDRLRRLFDRSWPDLESKLKVLPKAPPNVHRSQEELLTEVLETVRSLARRFPPTRSQPQQETLPARYDSASAVARIKRRLHAISDGVFPAQQRPLIHEFIEILPPDDAMMLWRRVRTHRDVEAAVAREIGEIFKPAPEVAADPPVES